MKAQNLFSRSTRLAVALFFTVSVVTYAGCGDNADQNFFSMGTAPIGGAFFPVGTALAQVLNEHGDGEWDITAVATNGTRENIRKLDKGDLDLALANSSITYHAVRGIDGWEKKFPVQTLMTLAPNVGHFVTLKGSGIETLADLNGKRVGVGPAGAGFEFFLKPLLAEHGISYDDITPLNSTQSGMVELLANHSADAVFLGGAMPQPSITQACASLDVFFIPFDADARKKLIDNYDFFSPITVSASTYSDLDEDFEGLNVGSMHIIVPSGAEDDTIYKMTKTLWENRAEVVKKHGVGKAINRKNAARYTGTDFHPGAIKFYKEIKIWKEPAAENTKKTNE